MSKKAAIPDAWDDDDWNTKADQADAAAEAAKTEEQVKLTKAQRLAQHAEANKKIWQSAYVLLENTVSHFPNNVFVVKSLKSPTS